MEFSLGAGLRTLEFFYALNFLVYNVLRIVYDDLYISMRS